ncbi:MAG: Hint domain-containing protein [Blastocatellia bacterium]
MIYLTLRKRFGRAFISLLVMLVLTSSMPGYRLAGQTRNAPEKRQVSLTEQERQDIKYVASLFRPGVPLVLNFADSAQYRFYKSQVERAGLNPKQNPQFFNALETARQAHIKSPPSPTPTVLSASADSNTPVPLNTIVDLGSKNQQATSTAFSTYPGGTDVTILTITVYDVNGNIVAPSQTTQQYGQGENVTATTAAPLQQPETLNGIATFYTLKDGNPTYAAYNVVDSTLGVAITNIAPRQVVTHPAPLIKVCTAGRTAPDCDYTVGGTTQVSFPIQGNAVYSGTITPPTPQNSASSISVSPPPGGACLPVFLSGDFFTQPGTTINYTTNTLTWNMNPAQFGSACWPNGANVTYNFYVQLMVNNVPVPIFVTNAASPPPTNTVIIPPMQIWYGCLAADTKIDMAGGVEKTIQTVTNGEKVVSNQKGTLLTVDNITRGKEEIPMIRIKDNKMHSLLLTETHPVPTSKGVLLAKQLTPGAVVFTKTGSARIVEVSKESFSGNIWNLDVGMPGDHVKLNQQNTTFYANGILVGDTKMQVTFTLRYETDQRTVLAKIPKEWHRDYLNYIAAKKRAKK